MIDIDFSHLGTGRTGPGFPPPHFLFLLWAGGVADLRAQHPSRYRRHRRLCPLCATPRFHIPPVFFYPRARAHARMHACERYLFHPHHFLAMTIDPKPRKQTCTTPGLQGRQCAEPFWQSPFVRTQRIHPIFSVNRSLVQKECDAPRWKKSLGCGIYICMRVIMVLEVVNIWGNVCMYATRGRGIMC